MSTSTSKRQSTAPPSGPKPPVNFSSSLTIPKDASLQGTHSITLQAETVIHPRARFDSNLGSILVGRRCIIHERVSIGMEPKGAEKGSRQGGVSVGDYVVIEVGSHIEAGGTEIGEGTIIQVGCEIGSGARIGKNCTISSRSVVAAGDVVPDQTVIYSNGQRRIDKRPVLEARKANLTKQVNVARKMIKSDPDKFR